ncbi:MAG: DUF58 domain-containing protein [Pirellulales bacterium]
MKYLTLLALVLLIGILFNASAFVYSAYLFAFVYLTGKWLTHRWAESLEGVRSTSQSEVTVGDSIAIGIEIINRSKLPIVWLLLEDFIAKKHTKQPPVSLTIHGTPLRLFTLAGKSRRFLTYRVTTERRGYYQLGPLIAETGDLFGLYRKYRILTDPHYVLVLPRIHPLAGYDVASKRPIGAIRVTYRHMEDPTLVSTLREYQQGDPIRKIHWRATARTGVLHSKVYEPTCIEGAMLIVDLHPDSNPSHHEPIRTDLAITAAASICHTLYQVQQPFGLLSNGADAIDTIRFEGWESDYRTRREAFQSIVPQDASQRKRPVHLPLGKGADHFRQCHQLLARLHRHAGLTLSELLLESHSQLPRDATLLVLVQQINDASALALSLLQRRGYAVAAIINHYETQTMDDAAQRLASHSIPLFHLHDEHSISQVCKQLLFAR